MSTKKGQPLTGTMRRRTLHRNRAIREAIETADILKKCLVVNNSTEVARYAQFLLTKALEAARLSAIVRDIEDVKREEQIRGGK